MSTQNAFVRRLGLAMIVAGLVIAAGCSRDPVETPQTAAQEPVVPVPVTIEPPVAVANDNPAPPPKVATAPPAPEEVVVATQRKSENLQDVPIAVSALEMRSYGTDTCCPPHVVAPIYPQDRENYEHLDENAVKVAREEPVSTFSIDVDTGSYSNVRRFLNGGSLPPQDAVRVEELINYFPYSYDVPASTTQPFAVSTALAPAPWSADKLLLRIGIKGYEVPAAKRAPANLVFLIDVSGSMEDENKLPLLKRSLALLARQLRPSDRVSM